MRLRFSFKYVSMRCFQFVNAELLLLLKKFFKGPVVPGLEILTHLSIRAVKISALFGASPAAAFAGVLVFARIALFCVIFQKIPKAHIRQCIKCGARLQHFDERRFQQILHLVVYSAVGKGHTGH